MLPLCWSLQTLKFNSFKVCQEESKRRWFCENIGICSENWAVKPEIPTQTDN